MFANWRTNSVFLFSAQNQESFWINYQEQILAEGKMNPIKAQDLILGDTRTWQPCSGHSKTAMEMDR